MASQSVARTDWSMTRRVTARTIPGVVGITAMEIRKLAHRPMTWAIFGLPAVLAVAWFPVAYLVARAQGTVVSMGSSLFPPGYIPETFGVLTMLGPICVAVLAAGLIGSEYGWGTMRVLVGTGVPRNRLLGAKLLALAVALAVWIAAAVGAATLSSVAVTLMSGHSLSFGMVDAAWFGDLGLMFGRTWLLLAAWLSIAAVAAVVGRSLAAGIAVPIVWQVLEGILSNVVGLAGSFGAHLHGLLITTNAYSFGHHDVFGPAPALPGMVSQMHAVVVIAGYAVVMLAVALVVFVRRDYTASA